MLGRRSYARVTIAEGAEGVLRLARDIGVSERKDGNWIATSREAGILGETVVVDVLGEGITVAATIIDSKPILTDGAVRHRLWLRRLDVERRDPTRAENLEH
jgi:hypothetical protein